ncbi:MAG: tRNA (adenosine(37)-N6)-dimethylallyltransferase MiaA [Dehalococcoidales bacterium]|nr:MAG: tRNA (adenosine(37)-N6)-dimethylallyltransferase MiaA [Dehalococcoidales bacterium]
MAIIGPTGTGKSRLAFHLAQDFNTEIVSADSRQVYRYMDIGTAKPTREELSVVPHHLIDTITPSEDFSLGQYQRLASKAIENIQHRGRLPLLVGGSGLYVWAVLEGWQIPRVPPDTEFRARMEKQVTQFGIDRLYQELVRIDPLTAKGIDPRNVRRVIRALEINRHVRVPVRELRGKRTISDSCLIMGLTADRTELYRRTDARVDEMIDRGFVAEVKKLLGMGYGLELSAMSGIGYKQISRHLLGELDLAEAIEQIKVETHRLVRLQYNWFRLKDERIHWLDIKNDVVAEASRLVEELLTGT